MEQHRPRATRSTTGRVIAGVAAGLAGHLDQPVFRVRLAFAIASLLHGAGIALYFGFWIFLPLAGELGTEPDYEPGTESESEHRAARVVGRTRHTDGIQVLGLVLMAAGAVALMQVAGLGVSPQLLGPLAVAAIGLILVWRQFDEQRSAAAGTEQKSMGAVIRIIVGMFLVGVAAVYLLGFKRGLADSLSLLATVAIALLGMTLVLGPWIIRLFGDLALERRERIRTQERADVAAHLHDSVLQTLALLQRNAEDPGRVATLARRQERELREWLYGEARTDAETLSSALTSVAAEVEHDHLVVIEVITVSDASVDDRISHLLLAARESMVNAAKHAGADRIDVYAEVAPGIAEVFIRDRGVGFDPESVPHDRLGIRGSIVDRMGRHNGHAELRSASGEGTSIRLAMPLEAGSTETGAETQRSDDTESSARGQETM